VKRVGGEHVIAALADGPECDGAARVVLDGGEAGASAVTIKVLADASGLKAGQIVRAKGKLSGFRDNQIELAWGRVLREASRTGNAPQ
jgi:hypothetical protein